MSKDMIGSVVRAAVSVPQRRMKLLARIASDLASDNMRGDDWYEHYMRVREQGLPAHQFERSEHGHILLTVTGLNLAGEQDVNRLNEAGLRTSDYAKSCLISQKADGYDKNHRLDAGREYKIALIPGKEVEQNRTTATLQEYAATFGYEKPLAGIAPRIRETVSDELMEKMGFWYITTLHDPIRDSGGTPNVLTADRRGDGRWLDAYWGDPDDQWLGNGAFAFVVPAS